MNLFKKIAKQNEQKQLIKKTIKSANSYLLDTCATMDKLLKLIHYIEEQQPKININVRECFQTNQSLNILDFLGSFEYFYSNYKNEVAILQNYTKDNPKAKLKIKNPDEVIYSVNASFIEIYSRFLVKIQFSEEFKNLVKEKFIEIIQTQQIPLHTNENSNNKN